MSDIKSEREYFFDKPENLKKFLRVFYGFCIVLVALDIVNLILQSTGSGELRHAERSWEGLPTFYSVYGFVACVVLVLIAKQMRKVLMRDEDYYDR